MLLKQTATSLLGEILKELFQGTVLGYDKEEKFYTIAYDDEDELHSFPLLDDLEKGELIIIS